jgi:hypothetical protein
LVADPGRWVSTKRCAADGNPDLRLAIDNGNVGDNVMAKSDCQALRF